MKLTAVFIGLLLLAPAAGSAAGGGAAKASAKKAKAPAKKIPAGLPGFEKIVCPEGSPLAGKQPAEGFIKDGAGVMVCSAGSSENGGPRLFTAPSLLAFGKDGKTQDLAAGALPAQYRIRAEGGAKLVAERGLRLPVAEKGRERRWVPVARREAACDGSCSLSAEACGIDAAGWSLAGDTVKKARGFAGANSSGKKGKYEEGFSSQLLAAALSGDRSAAHYLQNGGTMFDLDDAARASLAEAVKSLQDARNAGCAVGN